MSSPAPSAHAARAGAWALIVALTIDLVFSVMGLLLPLRARGAEEPGAVEWFRWLQWFGDATPPLRAMVAAIAVVALLRLRRGTADAGARAMFLGTGVLMALAAGWGAWFSWSAADAEAAQAYAAIYRTVATVLEQSADALLLAALWRARRAWGHGIGLAWSCAALFYALRLALVLGFAFLGPAQVDEAGFVRHQLMHLAFVVSWTGALIAALFAYARTAPDEPASERLAAAAAGLDTYFRALVARVTIVVVGGVVTLAFGLTSPAMRAKLLFGALVLAVPTMIAQVAGLTRYADAPIKIGRGALGVALLGSGIGLTLEILTLALFHAAVWPESAARFGHAEQEVLQSFGLWGQVVGLVTAITLLISLRRAATGLESAALQRRAARLAIALVAVIGSSFALLRLFGEALARAPLALLGLGAVALVVGVTMFISWLRLIEGVAQELRAKARVS
ncbi:hypothetical protein [Nannocystis radixulma]|uniref:Uncharacterized protein n=1 Tax=Nannocystis radixulma TaxID=2995305 RepID=A0ABT5B346_9BACT|nr:hypothetical protein [Nannocystis radixulma]MDC0668537.1 hypothetical protein [Nannocystis radixulma]